MKRRRKTSADADRGKYKTQIQAWRQHPDDPWAELERLNLTEIIGELGWSQPRVTRAMNSVASEERFRLKVHRAMKEQEDRPLYLRGGVHQAGTPEADHGYTHDASHNLDTDAEIIDLPTLDRLKQESEGRRAEHIEELMLAMDTIRSAVDAAVRARPGLMREVGREVWQLRGRVDAAHAKLKRKMAA